MTEPKNKIEDIINGVFSDIKRALARAISIVENDRPGKEQLIAAIYSRIGKAHRIGIAGPPGVGKSTLTLQLATALRAQEKTVGIVAVDPTSPFTGGALLGDRIRMTGLFNDPGVFIRSMATRGSMGGLAVAATEAADVLDASGKDVVIFETVGIGQTELDIAEASDTVMLVLAPESGDGVQALKAGFMEIADLYVINKSDREGADRTVIEINSILSLKEKQPWDTPVLKTVASENKGISEVIETLEEHFSYLRENDLLERQRNEQLGKRVRSIVWSMLRESFWEDGRREKLDRILAESGNTRSPYGIARELVRQFFHSVGNGGPDVKT